MKEAFGAQKASPLLFFRSLSPLSLQDLSDTHSAAGVTLHEAKLVLDQTSYLCLSVLRFSFF